MYILFLILVVQARARRPGSFLYFRMKASVSIKNTYITKRFFSKKKQQQQNETIRIFVSKKKKKIFLKKKKY